MVGAPTRGPKKPPRAKEATNLQITEGDCTAMMTCKVRGGGVRKVSNAAQRDTKGIIMAVRKTLPSRAYEIMIIPQERSD